MNSIVSTDAIEYVKCEVGAAGLVLPKECDEVLPKESDEIDEETTELCILFVLTLYCYVIVFKTLFLFNNYVFLVIFSVYSNSGQPFQNI